MKLYYTPGACSQAPHIVLHELDLRYEPVKVDLVKHTLPDGSDYRAINPKGYVPMLELDDGTRLTEANVLLQYLADRKPGTLAPPTALDPPTALPPDAQSVEEEQHSTHAPVLELSSGESTPSMKRTSHAACIKNSPATASSGRRERR